MALTPAQKMQAYRKRQKEKGLKQINKWVKADVEPSPPEGGTDKHHAQWEQVLKQEQLQAARKEGRKLARLQDTTRADGHTGGICDAAAFFIGRDRVDIAQALLSHFMIDRDKAAGVLEADKRTNNMTLSLLDKAGAWEKPPKTIK
jgi:hypothetical protein